MFRKNLNLEVWSSLGDVDPDWGVASAPGRKHGGWLDNLDEFYETGSARVCEALDMLPEPASGRALDWGSGTGRLSFALASKFERVTCVDSSATMLKALQTRASERRINNLELVHLNDFIPSANHDFVISLITLQHLSDRDEVVGALGAMAAALRPGGQMLVEIPLRPHTLRATIQPRLQAYRILRRAGARPASLHRWGLSGISMLCAPKDWVERTLESNGLELLMVNERNGTMHLQAYYVARRPLNA